MKNVFAKNLTIVGLLMTNVASGVYIISNWERLQEQPKVVSKKDKSPKQKRSKEKISSIDFQTNGIEVYRSGVVKEAILRNTPQIEKCYNKYLKTEPTEVEGVVTVHWTIGANGDVIDANVVKADLQDKSLIDCVLVEVRAWKFSSPPDRSETLVAHRFSFKRPGTTSLTF